MNVKALLLEKHQSLIAERKRLLFEETHISKNHCRPCSSNHFNKCEGCPLLNRLSGIGEALIKNTNEVRDIRQQLKLYAPNLNQRVINLEKEKIGRALNTNTQEVENVVKATTEQLDPNEYWKLHNQGKLDKEIQHIWGISHTALSRFKKLHGITTKVGRPKKSKPINLTLEQYLQFKDQGLSDKEIRLKIGIDHNQLHKFKLENNLIKSYGKLEQLDNDKLKALEEKLDYATKYIEQLIAKNERLNQELWGSRLGALYTKQSELDYIVESTQGLKVTDHLDDQLLGLIAEIVETANEHKGFKYWKVKKEVNRELVLEETVDILHFLLSRGNAIGKQLASVEVKKLNSITEQFLELIKKVVHYAVDEANYQDSFNLYVGLTEMLGFTWLEIEAAYNKKHAENISRQQNGY